MGKYDKDSFSIIVKESINLSDVCRNLNLTPFCGNRQTVKKYIDKYELNVNHFKYSIPKDKESHNKYTKIPLKEILVKNSLYTNRTHLKNKLYKEGLKKRKCELCGQGEIWNDMKISLILDHKNGVNNDNRIENLRIVCPNCNAGLETHGGKNISNKYKYKSYRFYYCDCGEKIKKGSKTCVKCSQINQRKVKRPTHEQLLNDLKETNYTSTGKKYGVSDNTVRNWLKYYDKK